MTPSITNIFIASLYRGSEIELSHRIHFKTNLCMANKLNVIKLSFYFEKSENLCSILQAIFSCSTSQRHVWINSLHMLNCLDITISWNWKKYDCDWFVSPLWKNPQWSQIDINWGSLIKRFNTVLLYCIDFPWQIYAASQCFQYTYILFVRCHTHKRLIKLRAFITDFMSRTAEFKSLLQVLNCT